MKVIVGLGNPGTQYQGTRHNVGFVVVDMLAEKHGIQVKRIKHKALIGEGTIDGEKVVLAKPQTYMNASGESVLEIVRYFKLQMDELIVVYDDIDLEPGSLRIRPSGSAGTHNGMRSIIYQLQEDQFPRIRVGIGKPSGGLPLAAYVLQKQTPEESEKMLSACKNAVEAVSLIIKKDIQAAMNQCNISVN